MQTVIPASSSIKIRFVIKNDSIKSIAYQFMFSDSALFFKIHLLTVAQSTGLWASSVHYT